VRQGYEKKEKPCRNCENKKIWRRECTEACNTFFIFAYDDGAVATLNPLVLGTVTIPSQDVQMYSAYAPKIIYKARKDDIEQTRLHSMICRERNLRFSIMNGGTGRVLKEYPRCDNELLKLFVDAENGERSDPSLSRTDSSPTALSGGGVVADSMVQPVPMPVVCSASLARFNPIFATQSVSSNDDDPPLTLSAPCAPLIASPIATRANMDCVATTTPSNPIVATVLSSPMRNRCAAVGIYEEIIDEFAKNGGDGSVVVSNAWLKWLICGLPHIFHDVTDTVKNDVIAGFYRALGADRVPMLLVKSSLLQLWVNMAASLDEDIEMHIGFVSMHSMELFDEICNLSLLPCALTEREIYMHASYELAASATLPGTHPVLCVFYAPHASRRAYASTVIPLGL
jgi:hypothetical protein